MNKIFNIQELEEKTDVKRFSCCVMNPPYDKNLHLKFLNNVKDICKKVISIQPIRWLQDPLADEKKSTDWKKYKELREKITDIDVIKKDDAFKLFNITNSEDLGIYYIYDGGFEGFSSKKLVKKIYDKIKDNLCKIDVNKKDGWRIRIATIANSNHRTGGLNNLGKLLIFKDGLKNGKPWYSYYQKNKWSKTTPEITHSIKFNSEEEANNFIKSVENTKFGKWYEGNIITDMNICNKNILWLQDYTHEWTDEELYKLFNLTDNEIEIIENEVKND